MNLEDKNIRKALAEKYLSAETSVEVERALAIYYSDHQPEEDEKALAAMVTAAAGEWLLSDEGAKEFDRIASPNAILLKTNIFRWAAGIAVVAAAVALFFILNSRIPQEKPISPVEIAEGIDQLMNLKPDDITSITAIPKGSRAILTAKLKDGSECSYIMTIEEGTGNLSLVAVNIED